MSLICISCQKPGHINCHDIEYNRGDGIFIEYWNEPFIDQEANNLIYNYDYVGSITDHLSQLAQQQIENKKHGHSVVFESKSSLKIDKILRTEQHTYQKYKSKKTPKDTFSHSQTLPQCRP